MKGFDGWSKLGHKNNFQWKKKFSKKKKDFEKRYNSSTRRGGLKSNTPNERPVRGILKRENRLILSIIVFELFAIQKWKNALDL